MNTNGNGAANLHQRTCAGNTDHAISIRGEQAEHTYRSRVTGALGAGDDVLRSGTGRGAVLRAMLRGRHD